MTGSIQSDAQCHTLLLTRLQGPWHPGAGIIYPYFVEYHSWVKSVVRNLPQQLRARLACHTLARYATMNDSTNNPATSHDVNLLRERCCHECGTSVQESQMLFLDKKSRELLFTREDDGVSDGEFLIGQV